MFPVRTRRCRGRKRAYDARGKLVARCLPGALVKDEASVRFRVRRFLIDGTIHAIEAACSAALNGDTRYPPTDGTAALKAAISRKFKRDNNLDYEASQTVVSAGGKQVIFNAMLATCNPGDEVVIPTPSWVSYADIDRFTGGVPVAVPCFEQAGFKLRAEDLEAAITPRTREDAKAGYIAAYKAGKSVVDVSNLETVLKAKGLVVDI